MTETIPASPKTTTAHSGGEGGLRDKVEAAAWPIASLLLLVGAWQLAVLLLQPSAVILPSPGAVVSTIVDRRELLFDAAVITTRDVILGFLISLAVGIPIAVAIAASRIVEKLVFPVLVVSQAIPKVAIAPLLLIWFGFGSTTNILLAVSLAVFPIIVNLTLGLKEIDADLIRLGRVMGSTPTRLFLKVRFPNALPNLLAGMKLAITFSAIGTVVGEFFAGSQGLGYIAQAGAGSLDTPLTFASVAVLSILTLILFYAVTALETLVLRGRPANDH